MALEGIKLISQDMQVGVSKLVHALCLHLDAKMEDEDSTEEDPAWAQLAGEVHYQSRFPSDILRLMKSQMVFILQKSLLFSTSKRVM